MEEAAQPSIAAEQEDEQQNMSSAVDPETGEIDWDCPCLGNALKGPCGGEFKEAFSCFVYSKTEEKGMDCIPQFRAMQECFAKNADYYGSPDDDKQAAPSSAAAAGGEQEGEQTEQAQQEEEGDVVVLANSTETPPVQIEEKVIIVEAAAA